MECPTMNGKNPYICTPYLIHGDYGTLIPLTYNPPLLDFARKYIRTYDDESIALDIKFPIQGHDMDKPFYLCLHGLNGGSNEPYVLDFVHRAIKQGSGTACMIARGMMGIPITKGHVFNGSRYEDIGLCIRILRQTFGDQLKIFLVGFSMGGIISSLYLSRLGKNSGVCGAVVFSTTAHVSGSPGQYRSRQFWQAPISFTLKVNLFLPSQPWLHSRPVNGLLHEPTKELIQSRSRRSADLITMEEIEELERHPEDPLRLVDLEKVQSAACMVEFDNAFSANYFGYKDAVDFYTSCCPSTNNGLNNISVPILFLNAADDPVVEVDGIERAINATNSNENIFVQVTKQGGHVGWPVGLNPWSEENTFAWNHTLAFEFVNAVLLAQKDMNFKDVYNPNDDDIVMKHLQSTKHQTKSSTLDDRQILIR